MEFPSFAAFVTERYPKGMGADLDKVPKLVGMRHRHEAVDRTTADRMTELRRAVTDLLNPVINNNPGPGGDVRITNIDRTQDDASNVIRRLKRDDPALARRVVVGEISAHAAAVQAGIRRKTVSVPVDPERAARTIRRHFTAEQIDDLIPRRQTGVMTIRRRGCIVQAND